MPIAVTKDGFIERICLFPDGGAEEGTTLLILSRVFLKETFMALCIPVSRRLYDAAELRKAGKSFLAALKKACHGVFLE